MAIFKISEQIKEYNLEDFISKLRNVYIFGTGIGGTEIFNCLSSHGVIVKAFLDFELYRGCQKHGLDILLPLKEDCKIKKENCTIIIAIFNREVDISNLINSLREAGF